jgi:DNA polymerase IV
MKPARVILHVDMDAFYAAVEVRENPSLAGKPVIVGHRGARGVVSTCSYEARRFGVHSAMPSVRAERLCPQAVWLPGNMALYGAVSREIRHLFDEFTPDVEPLSIDEAFLDLTGIVVDLHGGCDAARQLKERIRTSQGITASVGVAPNKFLAKVASDLEKPDGLVELGLEAVPHRLWPLPVNRLWGVGPKTAARLQQCGVHTVGDVLHIPEDSLCAVVGPAYAAHLRALSRGEDARPVETEHEAKSISEERTYGHDLTDPDAIDRALLQRAEGVARELRQEKLAARTVQIKVRAGDFTTWTRAHTLPAPTDLAETIVAAARELFRDKIALKGRGVRLLGVGVSGLEPASSMQPSLFGDAADERARRLAQAADAVRAKLGREALVRARLLRPREPGSASPSEASSPPTVD